MEYIHEISLMMIHYRIAVHVEYIPTKMNVCADSLSRADLNTFHKEIDLFGIPVDDKPTELAYYDELTMMKRGIFK